jgi:hypothetical protein
MAIHQVANANQFAKFLLFIQLILQLSVASSYAHKVLLDTTILQFVKIFAQLDMLMIPQICVWQFVLH